MEFSKHISDGAEPITLEEARLHCEVDGSDHDQTLLDTITHARQYIERQTNLDLTAATWEWNSSCWPDHFTLPAGTTGIVSIRYVNQDGDDTLLDPGAYEVILPTKQPAKVYPVGSWPGLGTKQINVTVRYTVGNYPALAKRAVLLLLRHWFDNRSAEVTGTITKQLEIGLRNICNSITDWSFYA